LIFADTSFWVALRNDRDQRHDEAQALWAEHAEEDVVTTNHVRGETWTLIGRRENHNSAVNFLDALERSQRIKVLRVSEELEAEALRWLRRHDEREYSFVDATSFALMRSQKIDSALAFDGDFAAAGFTELRP
jgi:predicted nucleic acid-binding protein